MHIQPHSQSHSSRKFSWILKERLWLFPSLGYIFHVLRVFSRNVFLRGLFFLCFWRNVYRSALVPHPPALKNIWLRTSTQALFSWKTIHLKCFYSFLNTSILETVRWFYALYCIRHILNNYGIFNTVFFRCIGWILAYSIIFSVIKAYSHILRHY